MPIIIAIPLIIILFIYSVKFSVEEDQENEKRIIDEYKKNNDLDSDS